MATEKKSSVTVAAKQPSRWRVGLQFTAEARTVEVTEDQLKLIEADPLLAIVITPAEDKKAK